MNKQSGYRPPASPTEGGFTLIELMIVVAIIGILVAVFSGLINGPDTKCVAGYTYIQQMDGQYHQVISDTGVGIRCTK